MHRFHIAERGQHHFDLGGLENAAVFLVIAILHLDVGLREKAEYLRQQVALMLADFLRPVAAVLAKGYLFGHPVDLLLAFPEIISPGIFKGLVGLASFEKRHRFGPRFKLSV